MKIETIPATPKAPEIVRVGAYARASADKEAAFHSLGNQVEYYESFVAAHENWVLVDTYSDGAVSGTKIDRPEFQRMMEDARAGKLNQIVTKSITRFARNTVVLLSSIRELKQLGVDVYFEKENLHSISPDGELFITLLALFAEEEARSASENQKWRIKKKFELGQTTVGRMLGYRLKDGKLHIVPEEAEIVRRIYREFLAGKSMMQIAKDLNKDEIKPRYGDVWRNTVVQKILVNEKYTGNMILQKRYRLDFRTKKDCVNKGERQKYKATNSHDAIISQADFDLAQQKLKQNREKAEAAKPEVTQTHLFTGVMTCGLCGSAFVHSHRCSGKYKHPVWICRRYSELGKSACPNIAIREDILIAKTKEVLGLGEEAELTREIVLERIKKIVAPEPFRLVYQLKDGTEIEVEWRNRSRRESWTPEMREVERQRTWARHHLKDNGKETDLCLKTQ